MKLDTKILKSVEETKYLSTENTWRYRPIIRLFFKNQEKMKYWLYKEDLFEELKAYEEFSGYTMDNLKNDLAALVEYKNLVTMQDTAKVKTVEEFKNKQFRYQLSPNAIEIERLVIRLENLTTENKGSLEPSLIERLKESIEKIELMKVKEPKEVYQWWNQMNDDFKKLNENYQDYIRGFYSPKAEELMQTTEFLAFKESVIQYLREFIKGLQLNAMTIERLITNVNSNDIEFLVSQVLVHEKSIPRMEQSLNEQEFLQNHIGRWTSIHEWFMGSTKSKSDSEKLMDFTNDIIMKITRYAVQISERKNSAASRKIEYRKLLKMFKSCTSLEDAHMLSAVTIGVFNMRHIKGNNIRETESINSSIFEEAPHQVVLKPRIRAYREKTIKSPIRNNEAKKLEKQKAILQLRERERRIIENLIVNSSIDFSKLPKLSAVERHTLLRWVSKANGTKSRSGRTEYGKDYVLIPPQDNSYTTLECEDGKFTMPAYTINFKG